MKGAPTQDDLLAVALRVYEQSRSIAEEERKRRYEANRAGYEDHIERQVRAQAAYVREIAAGDFRRWEGATARLFEGSGYQVDKEAQWFRDAAGMVAEATVSAVDVVNRRDRGQLNAQPASEVLDRAIERQEASRDGLKDEPFSELVSSFMRQWKADRGSSKQTNTEQQKQATYRLFGEFWSNRPIRGVRHEDAAEFRDKLKLLHPEWARSPDARVLPWSDLCARYGDQPKGLSASTMNRHMRALQSLWQWAKKRGHCAGDNPFADLSTKLKIGENVHSYRAWENDELAQLFDPLPGRHDLLEVIIVGMFTGMRLDEIASLTWGRIKTEGVGDEAISYFDINDAKTVAGIRQVPVHPALAWLLGRSRGSVQDRVWPKLNPEGVAKKPGADASREFSRFKIGRGFTDRLKTFHSFRKNVTRIMERAGVPENEWAQVFGHERGFTYSVYNPDGITLQRKREIISLISYPGLNVPHPAK